jgi:hypothetical protein
MDGGRPAWNWFEHPWKRRFFFEGDELVIFVVLRVYCGRSSVTFYSELGSLWQEQCYPLIFDLGSLWQEQCYPLIFDFGSLW